MKKQKIEPDYQQLAEVISEVTEGAKLNALEHIVEIFIENVESEGYPVHEIIQAVGGYVDSKYEKSAQLDELIRTLEKAVKEAEKLHETTKNA